MEENKEKVKIEEPKQKNKTNPLLIILIVLALAVVGSIGYVVSLMVKEEPTTSKSSVEKSKVAAEYRLNSNGLEKFDIAFLKLENNSKNMIYSPLSIKYTLQMLGEGANGNSKTQINSIIGDYKYKKYNNNANMSFANGMFIRDSYKNKIKQEYIDNLKNRYNAEVVTDSFEKASTINNWVKDKTFNLIDEIEDDESIQDLNFALVNALAINMNWTNLIQDASTPSDIEGLLYYFHYVHEDYGEFINPIGEDDEYPSTDFAGGITAKSVKIGASANKYDIVNELGRDNIKKEIETEYTAWMDENDGVDPCSGKREDASKYAEYFIEELDKNYKQLDKSTDFYFEDNDDIKVFAKDLKGYDGTQLQYVGIMPKIGNLKNYINKVTEKDLKDIIENLKPIELSSFEEGVVTRIKGTIPLFKFDYELNLNEDLQSLGITDIFDTKKSDLSNMIAGKNIEIKTSHKANIEFSNEGIKAAAVTSGGGLGDATCGFEHLYKVPVKDIDLTFDNPYLFLIRDKKSGEIWFVGTVYNPIEK